jgi:hypothetical protein
MPDARRPDRPRAPVRRAPAGAVDCHMHVFGPAGPNTSGWSGHRLAASGPRGTDA